MDDDAEVVLTATTVQLAKDTTQTDDASDTFDTPDNCLRPPEDLRSLARLTEHSPTRGSILDAMARNTVGLGYTLVPRHGRENATTDRTTAVAEGVAALEACARKDRKLDRPSFTELLMAVKRDEEECGQGYIEVSRDRRNGQIDGLYHAPGAMVRRLADRTGYMLLGKDMDPNRGVRFYNFGEKVQTRRDGTPKASVLPGKRWAVNELLPFKLYTSESRDYGLPRDIALATDYAGDRMAAESNVSFFDSSGTPPTILFVAGEAKKEGAGKVTFRVPQETTQRITDTLKSDSGRKHRVAIIPVPPGTDVNSVQLGEVSDRDMGFTGYREDNRQRALAAFRMQPIFIGVSDSGRYDAEVQRSITLEQVFGPEQTRYEHRLNATILAGLGITDLGVSFKQLAIEGNAVKRESAERAAEVGAITFGEFRDAHGLPRLKEGTEQVPVGWNDQLIPVPAPVGTPTPRVNGAQDQRGLRPGIGGRTSRDKASGQPRQIMQQQVGQLQEAVAGVLRGGATAASQRARNGAA
ncbi:phage portal protein [Mycobacterium sp.]|uniref:phage portal protein n=1 Tax=Mycobacterium sp. TaxID=1785 RepID=UPI002611A3D9|nr:phage portal protein [Mycobacterium sp.]